MKKIAFVIAIVMVLNFASYQLGRIKQYEEILNRFSENIKTAYNNDVVQSIIFNPKN